MSNQTLCMSFIADSEESLNRLIQTHIRGEVVKVCKQAPNHATSIGAIRATVIYKPNK
jgi:hypothetical protein